MTFSDINEYCLTKPGAYEDHPFGPFPVCYKVKDRIFLEWYPDEEKITVRCEPMLAELYRQQYFGIVIPGYHCPDRQRRYKNTVYVNREGLNDEIVLDMIDHSYSEAVKRQISKKR